jgi:multiple sugar transport system substrate-binding protein
MSISFKQKWGFLFLLFLTIAYLVLYYFLNAPQESRITEIYFADRITVAHRILIQKYNELNKGRVKVIPIDFPNPDFSTNDRKEMLARLLRGRGDGIDIFAVDPIWVQRFAKWSEPLNKYFSEADLKKIQTSALTSCYFEGELYSVPLVMVYGVLYYRDDLLKQNKNYKQIIEALNNQITYEDFIKLKNELNTNHPFYIFTGADYEGLICVYMELLLSLNRNYFEVHSFNFNTKEAQTSLQILVDLVNKYKIAPKEVTGLTEVPSYQYFIKNDGMFLRGWPSYDKDFVESPIDSAKEKYLRKAPLPHLINSIPTSIFGGWNLMISKFSTKKDLAIDFAKFLLSDESQEIFYNKSGHYPVVNSFYNSKKYLDKYPEILKVIDYMKMATHRPANVDYTKYSKILAHYINSAIELKMPVKEALSECTNAIQTDKVMLKEF